MVTSPPRHDADTPKAAGARRPNFYLAWVDGCATDRSDMNDAIRFASSDGLVNNVNSNPVTAPSTTITTTSLPRVDEQRDVMDQWTTPTHSRPPVVSTTTTTTDRPETSRGPTLTQFLCHGINFRNKIGHSTSTPPPPSSTCTFASGETRKATSVAVTNASSVELTSVVPSTETTLSSVPHPEPHEGSSNNNGLNGTLSDRTIDYHRLTIDVTASVDNDDTLTPIPHRNRAGSCLSPGALSHHGPRTSSARSLSMISPSTPAERVQTLEQLTKDLHELNLSPNPSVLTLPDADEEECGDERFDCDRERTLRIRDFQRARNMRHATYPIHPYGIYGLFAYLADLRLDFEWAETASYRRRNGLSYLGWVDFDAVHAPQFQPTSYITCTVVAVSTVMLVISIALNDWQFAPMTLNPMIGPEPAILVHMGALDSQRVIIDHEYARLILPMVLHAGILHYLVNMTALWLIGKSVERVHGSLFVGLTLGMATIGGNLASVLFLPHSVTVGASGGIFGLLGVCMSDILANWDMIRLTAVEHVQSKHNFPFRKVIFWLVLDVVVNVTIGLTPYVDNFAHLGGLYYGACLGLCFVQRLGTKDFFGSIKGGRLTRRRWWAVVGVIAAMVPFLASVLLVRNVESGGEYPCPKCRYISCMPFPFWKSDPDDRWWQCDACQTTSAVLVSVDSGVSAYIELTCPYSGEQVTVDIPVPVPSQQEIRHDLPGYCRLYCSN